jgi:hypothetical protein
MQIAGLQHFPAFAPSIELAAAWAINNGTDLEMGSVLADDASHALLKRASDGDAGLPCRAECTCRGQVDGVDGPPVERHTARARLGGDRHAVAAAHPAAGAAAALHSADD